MKNAIALIIIIAIITAITVQLNKDLKEVEKIRAEEIKHYIESVKNNTFYGEILETVYLSVESEKNDPASNAVAGAGTAYLLGFGPIGMIAGAAIGVEEGKEKNHPEEELYLICLESSTQDTFCFKILDYYPFLNIYQEIFYNRNFDSLKKISEEVLSLPDSIRQIKIPSSQQLPTRCEIIAGFLYLGKEKIPYLE